YNYPEHPLLGAFLLFPLTTLFASFFLAWLTLSSSSLWPAVLAHGSVNTFYGQVLLEMSFGPNRLTVDIIVLLVWLFLAAVSCALQCKRATHLANRWSEPLTDE